MKFNRIVVKVGTSTLTHPTGLPNIRRMEALVKVLADIKNTGRDIVLVTSGAIGVGAGKMGYSTPPTFLSQGSMIMASPAQRSLASAEMVEKMNLILKTRFILC